MVHSVCTLQSSGQGVCHSVAAHWLQPRREGRSPNLIVVRTTELAVYSVQKHNVPPSTNKESSEPSHVPCHTLQLEFSQELFGEVMSMACLQARRQNYRDSIVLAFQSVRRSMPCPSSWFLGHASALQRVQDRQPRIIGNRSRNCRDK